MKGHVLDPAKPMTLSPRGAAKLGLTPPSAASLRNAVEVRSRGWSWRLEDHGRHGKLYFRFDTAWEKRAPEMVPVVVRFLLWTELGKLTTVRS